jgi:hypothetical protein
MESIMGEVHTLASDLPTPSKFDAFQKRARLAADLWSDIHAAEGGSLEKQRAWLIRQAALQPMLPSLARDLATIMRPATRTEIAEALTSLRDVLHASKTPSATSNRAMAERVGSQEPSYGALKIAVLRLIDTMEWFPPPVKVLAALADANYLLEHTAHVLKTLPNFHERVSAALAEAERQQAFDSQRRAARLEYLRGQQEPPA